MRYLMKKRIIPFFLCLLFFSFQAGARGAGGQEPTTIPYHNVNGKLIVDVEIGGKVRPFLFDTGASRTCITDSLYRELNPAVIRQVDVRDSGGNRGKSPVVNLDTLRVGDWTFCNIRGIVISLDNPLIECYSIAGILGSDILQRKTVHISSRDSLLTFSEDVSPWGLRKKDGTKMTILGTRPHMKVYSRNGDRRTFQWMLIDTGASGYSSTVNNHFQHLSEKGVLADEQEAFGQSSYGVHGVEVSGRQRRGILPQMELNGVLLDSVPVHSTAGGTSLLGTFILKYGDVTIDYRQKRFYYHPFQDSIRVKEHPFSRLNIIFDDRQMVVGVIWDEELAQLIRPGDRVMEINGCPAEDYPLCDFFTGAIRFEGENRIRQFKVETQSGEILEIER